MSLRIIFMGTPEFAVPTLDTLINSGFNVVAVITTTDKMGGRGNKKLLQSPVKKYAVEHGIPVLQPPRLRNPEFVKELRSFKADLQVVVAFRMLPKVVWDMPTIGTVNLHGSLLPRYRGAAPINWAVIRGDKVTGATTFFIEQKIDTGNLLFQEKMPIGENDTAGIVHDKMMLMGADLMLKTVRAIKSGNYEAKPQDASLVTHAPKIFHETCKIDFHQPINDVHNFIRGMSPYPAAWTTLDNKQFKILQTTKEAAEHEYEPGKFISDDKNYLKVTVPGGYLQIHELQLQGKRRMKVRDFLNGYKFNSK